MQVAYAFFRYHSSEPEKTDFVHRVAQREG